MDRQTLFTHLHAARVSAQAQAGNTYSGVPQVYPGVQPFTAPGAQVPPGSQGQAPGGNSFLNSFQAHQTAVGGQAPPGGQGPPAGQVPSGSQDPPAGQVPPGGQGPPAGQVPSGSQDPLAGQVPPGGQGPPAGQVPPGGQGQAPGGNAFLNQFKAFQAASGAVGGASNKRSYDQAVSIPPPDPPKHHEAGQFPAALDKMNFITKERDDALRNVKHLQAMVQTKDTQILAHLQKIREHEMSAKAYDELTHALQKERNDLKKECADARAAHSTVVADATRLQDIIAVLKKDKEALENERAAYAAEKAKFEADKKDAIAAAIAAEKARCEAEKNAAITAAVAAEKARCEAEKNAAVAAAVAAEKARCEAEKNAAVAAAVAASASASAAASAGKTSAAPSPAAPSPAAPSPAAPSPAAPSPAAASKPGGKAASAQAEAAKKAEADKAAAAKKAEADKVAAAQAEAAKKAEADKAAAAKKAEAAKVAAAAASTPGDDHLGERHRNALTSSMLAAQSGIPVADNGDGTFYSVLGGVFSKPVMLSTFIYFSDGSQINTIPEQHVDVEDLYDALDKIGAKLGCYSPKFPSAVEMPYSLYDDQKLKAFDGVPDDSLALAEAMKTDFSALVPDNCTLDQFVDICNLFVSKVRGVARVEDARRTMYFRLICKAGVKVCGTFDVLHRLYNQFNMVRDMIKQRLPGADGSPAGTA